MFIHLIADYGIGDPAFSEVIQRLTALIPTATIQPTSVSAFDTLTTGFWIYQFALGDHPKNMLIYSNTAPRKDKKTPRKSNEGEGFLYAKLKNNVEVMAVNSGFCFSFIKPDIHQLRQIKVENKGSQFRSRDFYPKAIATHLKGEDVLGNTLNPNIIPEAPINYVAWIDGYGNIKTTIRSSQMKIPTSTKVTITINNVTRTAMLERGIFAVSEGELSFSPGSSGHDDRFMELILRGGSAASLFDNPKTSTIITIGRLA